MSNMETLAMGGMTGKPGMIEAMGGMGFMINPMTKWALEAYLVAVVFYLLSLITLVFPRKTWSTWMLGMGLAANLVSLGLRVALQWPMQAPYQGPFWITACLAALDLFFTLKGKRRLGCALLPVLTLLAALGALFHGDSYVPFPRSNTIAAHLSLLLISVGKAFFIASAVEALMHLFGKASDSWGPAARSFFGSLVVWGFVPYTLGLFLAEIWAYLAWSSPVVWEDFAMVSTMALWFFYSCFLHLHLLNRWSTDKRAWFALVGLPILFYFICLPELGPLALPEIGL